MINGPLSGQSFEIHEGETLIGRASDNHIQIVEQSISRIHAKILKRDDHYFLEDLESQNGTSWRRFTKSPPF